MINRDHHRGVKLAGNGKGPMKGRFATKGSEFLGARSAFASCRVREKYHPASLDSRHFLLSGHLQKLSFKGMKVK